MYSFKTIIPALFLFSTPDSMAQAKHSQVITWKVGALHPGGKGQSELLGVAGPVSGIHNDVLITGGGANFPDGMPWNGGKKQYYNDLYIFKKEHPDTLLLFQSTALPYPVAYAASCSTSKGLLVAGGENDTGVLDKVLLIQWNCAKEKIDFQNLPVLPAAVTNASIISHGNMVYLAGGEIPGGVSSKFLSIDLDHIEAGWKQAPGIPKPVSHAVIVVQQNEEGESIYLVGGRKKNDSGISDLYSAVYEFDLKKQVWEEKRSLPYALSAGTGIAIKPGRIVLFGGDKGETFNKAEILIAAFNREKDPVKKEVLNQQKISLQSNHPGFSREILEYNTEKDEWRIIGKIPFETPVTTTAIQWDNDVVISSGEIKAGVRTPQILMGKMRQEAGSTQ